ncbi:MAG: flagellar biosynthetic protein FliR [Deltaproteobacteria bacterium]|nr:flagellar biosynthetic protein FliR [Deltaproteobacteria bacterium]
MTTPIPGTEHVVLFFLTFARILALVSTLPVTGQANVPAPVKAGFSAFVALIAAFFMGTSARAVPDGFGPVALALVGEIFIGLAMGLSVKIAVEAAAFAGDMAGFQMGFTIANVIDPQTGAQVSILGNFKALLAAAIFVASGLYLHFIGGILESFHAVPPGGVALRAGGLTEFVAMGSELFGAAVSIGAPWIVVLLLAKIGLGLMARTVPQMNVFFVGFPVTIALGLLVIAMAMPFIFAALVTTFRGVARAFLGRSPGGDARIVTGRSHGGSRSGKNRTTNLTQTRKGA